MRIRTLIGAGIAVALAGAIWSYQSPVSAQGWGMMGGYGPGYGHMGGWRGGYGHMGGWGGGPGPGAGPWNCPAFGQYDRFGSADGQGYGPGYHMRGWGGGYGPGMMQGYGRGYGPGYDRRGDARSDQSARNTEDNQSTKSKSENQTLNLSTDDVKTRMERWLTWRGNPRLKVGDVNEKDADTITADIVTKDNSLVERFIIDRHTGNYRRSEN